MVFHSCPPFRDVGAESTRTPFPILSGDSYLTARSEQGALRHLMHFRHADSKVFLNPSNALGVLLVGLRLALTCENPNFFKARLDCVSSDTESGNSSCSRMIRSQARQRTTPWIAGSGPSSTIRARKALCVSSLAGVPGEGMLMRPSGPFALNRITQSRSVRRSMPPAFAASSRDADPSVCQVESFCERFGNLEGSVRSRCRTKPRTRA